MRRLMAMIAGGLLLATVAAHAQGNRAVTGDGDGPDCTSWSAPSGFRYEMCGQIMTGGTTSRSCCLTATSTDSGPNWDDPNLSDDETTPGTHQSSDPLERIRRDIEQIQNNLRHDQE
jgi:hypothetical protein